jgi:hypothetical protein
MKRFWNWLFRLPLRSFPPYRNVVSRVRLSDGDHLKLECGHRVHVIVNQRVSIPCEECHELGLDGPVTTAIAPSSLTAPSPNSQPLKRNLQ